MRLLCREIELNVPVAQRLIFAITDCCGRRFEWPFMLHWGRGPPSH